MTVLLVISLDSAACDVQQGFSAHWKNVQARIAETTAIEAATYRYNQCSKTATVPVFQALEQERKMHALGTPSFRSEKRKMLFKIVLRQEKAEFTEKVEQMSNLQVQSESKLQTSDQILFSIFSIQKKTPQSSPIGSLTPIFFGGKKIYISFGTRGIPPRFGKP